MIGSKGGISLEQARDMTMGDASAWLVALGEAQGGKWSPHPGNPLHFDPPESK